MKIVSFLTSACGNTPEEAFSNAVSLAQADYGCSGNTGTIADKTKFKMTKISNPDDPFKYAKTELNTKTWESTNLTKCIDAGNGEYVFYGFSQKADISN